jgi:xanthine dehydrogenase YagT iron-sulfur-binding subunit
LSFVRSSNRVEIKIARVFHERKNSREEVMEKGSEEKECHCKKGVTRRGFLQLMGAGAAASVTAGALAAEPTTEVVTPGEMSKVTLQINGRWHRLLIEPRWSLLYVIREKLGLTGTKVGCERGECGACTVLINGQPRYACLILALEAEGTEITTLEGLMKGEDLEPVQQAFVENDAFQCGYCTPGQIMAVEGLLRANPNPSAEEIRQGMSGNLCRCGTYPNIFKAVRRAAELKKVKGGA